MLLRSGSGSSSGAEGPGHPRPHGQEPPGTETRGRSEEGALRQPQVQVKPSRNPGRKDQGRFSTARPQAPQPSASSALQETLPGHRYPPQGVSGFQAWRCPWVGELGQLGRNVIDCFKGTGSRKAVSGCWLVLFV